MKRNCRMAQAGVVVLAVLCSAAAAQAYERMSPATQKLCDSVADAAPPAADLPMPAQTARLKGCDAEALYYGIGRKADPDQARLCAFVQRQAGSSDGSLSPGFAGNAILMTIYANGLGARRDLRLATHLACTISAAPAEYDGRVPNLLGKLKAGWTGHDFSWCDDTTSGYSGGWCAAHERRIAAASRDAQLDAYAVRLHGEAAAHFADLRRAEAAWAEARSSDEVDMSGTMRGAMAIGEQDMQDRDFLAMIQRLESGKPPRLGTTQLHAATVRLDDTLRRIAASKREGTDEWGTVTEDGIRKAQQIWQRYRDAWGAFAQAAYPAWGADAAEAWVTIKRADMLGAFLK